MRRVQGISVLVLLIALIGYGIFTKLSERFDFSYEYDSRYQIYNPDKPPKQVYFAGEVVPLENKTVAHRFSNELRVHTYYNVSYIPLIQRARHWLPQLTPILKQYKIPEDFKYLAIAESMLLNVESPQGAGGFWQIIPSTARSYGLEVNDEVDERYHPVKATVAACKYFREAYRIFGDWTSVAASYNAGMFAIDQAYRRQQKESFYKLKLNKQTSTYIFRVLALRQLLQHPREYGYKMGRHNPLYVHLRWVKVTQSITDLTAFAADWGITYSTLKKHNPWLLGNTLTIKEEGKTYTLLVPRQREIPEDLPVETVVSDLEPQLDTLPKPE